MLITALSVTKYCLEYGIPIGQVFDLAKVKTAEGMEPREALNWALEEVICFLN